MMKNSNLFNRAQKVVMCDKYGLPDKEFFDKLGALLAQYFDYDGLTVEMQQGTRDNMLLCVSVKHVRHVCLPSK